jgi:hypothetical protein
VPPRPHSPLHGYKRFGALLDGNQPCTPGS